MSCQRLLPGVLAALLGLALVACGGDVADEEAGEPPLAEPRLTLALEGVVLPEGVSADDVVVSTLTLDAEEARKAEEGSGTVAAFRLEPAGLQFAAPVPVTIELPAAALTPGGGATFVLVLTSDDGTSEILAVDDAQWNLDIGAIQLTTSVPHFSELLVVFVYTRIIADITPAPGDDFAVGSRFTVSAVVHRPRAEREQLDTLIRFKNGTSGRFQTRTASRPGPWSSATFWRVDDGSRDGVDAHLRNRSPSVESLAPVETRQTERAHAADATTTPTLSQEFLCERAGPFRIVLYARIDQPGTQTLLVAGSNKEYQVTVSANEAFTTMTGRCVLGTSTPTPTPTGSPTQTPTPVTGTDPWEAILEGGEAVPSPLSTIVRGQTIVFMLDGVPFATDGLSVIDAHEPYCSYRHVYGGPIRSIIPRPDGTYVEASEHLAECGYGPPNFMIIPDPR
ncbi:MAG: hypothetical protein O2798_03920 [Chloroflexi bacterium]|nr:hypothetical protein [Chloroflexota bacterium]